MRSPGRGEGGTGARASAFREGGATRYYYAPSRLRGLRARLSVRHYECRYSTTDRNTQSTGVKRKPHLEIWPHLAIPLVRFLSEFDMVITYYFC
jgi:hypothetical protein